MLSKIDPRRTITVDNGGKVTRNARTNTGSATRQPNPPPPTLATRGNAISASEAVRAVQHPESDTPQTRAYYRMAASESETLAAVRAAGGNNDFLFAGREWRVAREDQRSLTQDLLFGQEQNLAPASPQGWSDYQALVDLYPDILQGAVRWNPSDSGFSDEEFAAIMLANLHEEARLRRRNLLGEVDFFNQLTGSISDAIGDFVSQNTDYDASLGIANIREATAREIFIGVIPLPPNNIDGTQNQTRTMTFTMQPGLMSWATVYNQSSYSTLNNDLASIELLAVNVHRGILRIQQIGGTPSAFNVSTWLNQGVQSSQEFEADSIRSQQAFDHANRVLESLVGLRTDPTDFAPQTISDSTFNYINDSESEHIRSESVLRSIEYFRIFPAN